MTGPFRCACGYLTDALLTECPICGLPGRFMKKDAGVDAYGMAFDADVFRPSKDVDIKRILELDHRIMKVCVPGTNIDIAASSVMTVLQDFTSEEIATLMTYLSACTTEPLLALHLMKQRIAYRHNRQRKENPGGS